MFVPDASLVSVCLVVLGILLALRRNKSRALTLSGPPRFPIIGNILPQKLPWEALRLYSEKYGE